MILGFYKKIKGRPTNFREKILSCVNPVVHNGTVVVKKNHLHDRFLQSSPYNNSRQLSLSEITDATYVGEKALIDEIPVSTTFRPKKHTIRHDKNKRWRVGMSIQMVYRGKHYSIADHFNKGVEGLEVCQGIQKLTIKWRRPKWLQRSYGDFVPPFTIKVKNQYVFIYIDDRLIGHKTLKDLAINDGFESIAEFLHYFRKSIRNWRIIHFTNFKY